MLYLKAQIRIALFSSLNAVNYSKEQKAVQMIVSLYEHAEDPNFDTYKEFIFRSFVERHNEIQLM